MNATQTHAQNAVLQERGLYMDAMGDIRAGTPPGDALNSSSKAGGRRRGLPPGMVSILAKYAGVSQSLVSNVKHGRTKSLRIETLIREYEAGNLGGAQ